MECMLLPKKPTRGPTRVPYIDTIKYDGGEWLSYPQRRDEKWPTLDLHDDLPLHQFMVSLHESRELEPFLQTWLFFGLLSEVFGGNASETSEALPKANDERVGEADPNQAVRWVYGRFTFQDGGCHYVTTATLLQDLEDYSKKRSSMNLTHIKTSCIGLAQCLRAAWKVLMAAPKDFDPAIRASIGGIAEILSHSINYIFMRFQIPPSCPNKWSTTYFDQEPLRHDGVPSVRETMLSKGWCPSDISRSMNKFNSLQLFHFLANMDRSFPPRLPPRLHNKCNDVHCTAYQIDKDYEVRHVVKRCPCKLIHADDSAIIGILEKGESIPLLRFTGGIDDLKIEVVESSQDTPYIAISHVWADGLGNKDANALNSCELVRLRTLVEALGQKDTSMKDPLTKDYDGGAPFIWIDTLCCPVGSSEEKKRAKKIALRKIRNVYQHASRVLVLDASLEAYKAQEIGLIEQLLRIFTSGWLRRLWTLQEGALAESLYFQFADGAIPFDLQKLLLVQSSGDLRHRIFAFDFLPEYFRLQYFYHPERLFDAAKSQQSHSRLYLANAALQYRSVSVPSDEPLCLACIMCVSTTEMLMVDDSMEDHRVRDERMKILWKLIAERERGIPASIIFFEDPRIDARGWRWAPESLLTTKPQLLPFNTRILRWNDANLGEPTANGLRAKLVGYRIVLGNVHANKHRYLWEGITRLAESEIYFRDMQTKKWYYVAEKEYALMSKTWTEDARRAYNARNVFPINDLISKGDCYIIQGYTAEGSDLSEGIIASSVPLNERVPSEKPLEGIPVRTRHHVIFKEASPAQTVFQDAIESLAQALRQDELTDKLQALGVEDTAAGKEAYAAALTALKDKMKDLVKRALAQNPDFGPAVDSLWGRKWRDLVWVCVGDWYYHDFKIAKLPVDQIWYVD